MKELKKMTEKDYQIAVEMYKQYQNDVAKFGVGLNIYQIKTLRLLEENFRKFTTVVGIKNNTEL